MKNNKSGKILNVLLGVIAIFVIIFVIAWIVNRSGKQDNKEFTNNLNLMQDTAKEYFTSGLPEEIGDSITLSLKEMYKLGLIDTVKDGNVTCDKEESYISITKISDTEYKIKSNLVCGDKEDNITEKIENIIKVEDEDGNIIIDSNEDTVIESKEKKNGKKTTTAKSGNCLSDEPGECEITTDTDYCRVDIEYQHVKRNVSCPYGYSLSGSTCVKNDVITTTATANYSDSYTAHEPAKEAKGDSYIVYAEPIVTEGSTSYYCSEGTLSGNKCIITTSKATKNGCPSGYTLNGDYCYKYADKVSNTTYSCPSGYTKSGSGSSTKCYKKTSVTSTTTYSCPSGYTKSGSGSSTKCYKKTGVTSTTKVTCPTGYTKSGSSCVKTSTANKAYTAWGNPISTYQTNTKESTYTNELTKKVLVGSTSKKVAGKTIYTYTYSIYKRSSYYTCASGTLSGTLCYTYSNGTSTTTTSCPSGYTKDGSYCYYYTATASSTSTSCPSGYTKDGSTCYLYANAVTNTVKSCPSGYSDNGSNCVTKVNKTTTSSCPSGYTDNGSNCKKEVAASSNTTSAKYDCPAGYTKSGSGSSIKCSQTRQNDNTYYCERANATLVGNTCYYQVDGKLEGYSCPAGYSQDGNMCTKNVTDSVSPIWTNAEYIYSKNSFVNGYQRTGRLQYVTHCYAKTEEIHYK